MLRNLEILSLDNGDEVRLIDLGSNAVKAINDVIEYLKNHYGYFEDLYNGNPSEQVMVNEMLIFDEFIYLSYKEIERFYPEVYKKYYEEFYKNSNEFFEDGKLIELSYIGSPCYPSGNMGWYADDDFDPEEELSDDDIGMYLEDNFMDFAYKVIPTCVIRDIFLSYDIELTGVLNIYGIMKDTCEGGTFKVYLSEDEEKCTSDIYVLPV